LLQLVYYAFVVGSALARALPERLSYGLARSLGALSARRSKKRPQVERNLARITGLPPDSPEVKALAVEAFRSYARYWFETFALVRESREFFLDRFTCIHEDQIDAVLARGKGAVVVVGHLGNWDAAGAWVAASGRHLVAVAEVLRPRRMFDFFVRHRERLGMTIVPAQPGATSEMARSVEEGAVIAILGDRDLKGKGLKVEFFGEETTFPAGPASVALKTGVPLLVGGVYGTTRADGKRCWEAHISEPIEIPTDGTNEAKGLYLTQEVAKKMEEFVARHPEEWHVFQPFWIKDRVAK
jgi:KDO2-lipid IV(A) lauroyltransferase